MGFLLRKVGGSGVYLGVDCYCSDMVRVATVAAVYERSIVYFLVFECLTNVWTVF